MHRADWGAQTTQGEAFARARGRRRFAATRRDQAEARRLLVRRRLPALRKEAWATCVPGEVPRVTVGGIPCAAVKTLADELGVSPGTIRKDLLTIEREDLRRQDITTQLPGLRDEAGVSRAKGRLPKDVIWKLACFFNVRPWTIRRDIAAIDATTIWPRAPARQPHPWDLWTKMQPRPAELPRRHTVRLPQGLHRRLTEYGNPSLVIRQALNAFLDTGTHHRPRGLRHDGRAHVRSGDGRATTAHG